MKYLKEWKSFLLPAAITIIWMSAFLYIMPISVQAGESVYLSVGREISYGTYSTNYFTVDGRTAYCLEPLEDTPGSGSYAASPLESGSVRKGLYYMYGGPGYDEFIGQFGPLGNSADQEYCMSHCILSYLYSGNDNAFTGLSSSQRTSLKEKIENLKTMPDPPQSFSAFLFNTGGSGQTMGGVGKDKTGSIEIRKRSDHSEWTAGNPCYSLEGAVFGIYAPGGEEPLWTITTDENGYGSVSDIPIGSYEVAEIKSPQGFAMSENRQTITVTENTAFKYECVNNAQYHSPDLVLKKTDSETGNAKPQGAASLSGAEFEVKFYAGYHDGDPASEGVAALRAWVLRSDKAGEIRLSDEYKISGDDFFTNNAGQAVFPLGTVTVRETKAPEGYLLNETTFTEKIAVEGEGETDTVWHVPEVPERVIRGGLWLVKFRESDDEKEDQKQSLEGICFTVTSKTTGEVMEIVTDENGYAQTPVDEEGRGSLVYDTYVVSEKDSPAGLKPVEDFEVTISEEGKTLYYILENKKIFSPVRLVKKDEDSGETIPIAGAEFRILDHNKKPITMTTYYPQETVHDTFRTDESGSFTLPEKLDAGKYYFQEVQAPEGYVLSEDLVEFEITKMHDWAEPFVVEFKDSPAKGRICITKTDCKSKEALAGVHFVIRASEDILTPQGNVRIEAGTIVAELVTDEKGKACVDDLYLGKYEIEETASAEGYALDEKIYEAELKYKDQNTALVTENVEWENQPTTVIITKTDHETGTLIEGARFIVCKNDAESGETIFSDEYITNEDGKIEIRYLNPGNYSVCETKSAPGYRKSDTTEEFTVDEKGKINGEACMEFTIENDRTKIKDTTAVWKESGIKEIYPGEGDTITDTVVLENLEKGKEYTLRGILAYAGTGEIITMEGEVEGKAITAERKWTADEESMSIEMEFTLEPALFSGKKIVVLEYLYEGDVMIASHEEPEDEGQTVSVLKRPRVSVLTGDPRGIGAAMAAAFAAMTVSAVCIAVGYKRRRRKKL